MPYLIVNADDFGLSKGVNYGIIDAHVSGIVTSTTLMVNMPAAKHASSLAKKYPSLGVGVHLNLTAGKPIHQNVPSLVNQKGYFHSKKEVLNKANVIEIEKELRAQINEFYSFGLNPTHIDTHHNLHGTEPVSSIVKVLAEEYRLPIRQLNKEDPAINTLEFCSKFHDDNASYETLLDIFERASVTPLEMMCHPGFVDQQLLNHSSYNIQRIKELDILTDPLTITAIQKARIQLKSYKELRW
ncbi:MULTISPECIES: chitin disaccharide deacetylase [Niallia]|uniref:chitin disaccharide deacetylase n=1 Tax=Niallia TaxID=2837506 RepID=UPI001490728F|nr:chitin disaccharide deacetylase [Niallia circulans]QJX64106.1 chitin disaccharide deacetylase [Niallia circulans]